MCSETCIVRPPILLCKLLCNAMPESFGIVVLEGGWSLQWSLKDTSYCIYCFTNNNHISFPGI